LAVRWIRFSLRTLLVLTALVAGLCYWLARPTLLAERFAAAIQAADYTAADKLCADPDRQFFHLMMGDLQPRAPKDSIPVTVTMQRRTWRDLCRGQRHMELTLWSKFWRGEHDGPEPPEVSALGPIWKGYWSFPVTANRSGTVPPRNDIGVKE
jgi:hypothetical protein